MTSTGNREQALARAELLAKVRRGEELPLGVRGTHAEEELRAEVAEERSRLAEYRARVARGEARAAEAERLYAEQLGQAGEGFACWYLEEPELPAGGLGAELREEARERLTGESGASGAAGLGAAYGDAAGEPYLWRGQVGALICSGGALDGEPESWSRYLLFLSSQEAGEYLQGLREIDVELLSLELEEQAPTLLAGKARQAAQEALAFLGSARPLTRAELR